MIDKYQALLTYLAERANRPFEWGKNDCCIFAADWVLLVTGRDPMGVLRDGAYHDENSALELLDDCCGLKAHVTSVLQQPLPTVTTAQRGDVILFESGAGPALGICVGDRFAAIPPEGGVKYYAMRHAATAWRIE